ncbi:MAG: tetratricopeptide repeat protein [Pseudomonadota bacterium]
MTKAIFATLFLTLVPASASAQAFVIGGGMAKDCYTKVRDGSDTFRSLERLCTQALQQEALTPTNKAATYVNRGIARMRAERYDSAIEDYERAISFSEDLGAAYLNLGAALIFQRRYDEALAPLDKSITLESQDLFAAHYNRAIAREQSGDIEGAYEDFLRSTELKPEWDLARRQLDRFTVTTTN